MQVTEVSVRYGRTVQPRQYESERVEVGLTATVGEGESWVSVAAELGGQVRDTVAAHLHEAARQRDYARRHLYDPKDEPEDDGPPEDEG